LLRQWRDSDVSQRRRGRRAERPAGGLRFAFYGRFSTKEHQDGDSSRRWQLECADQLIYGFGQVVVEYMDAGVSRRRSWSNRPRAAALLEVVMSGAPGFDAVVVGEYERAFCGRQVFDIAALLHEHGIGLWLPETLGPVDLSDAAHRAVLIELGARSLREIQRDRHRAIEAMSAQAQYQGRYLGGRPPYGYRLADGGPHPNASHARWGRQRQQLVPDPQTAEHVRQIFARRLAGDSLNQIARGLNERGVLCPSVYDRDRNRHRKATGWTCTTVAAILANPRYTGRQVWNRQPTQHTESPGADAQQRTSRRDWIISDRVAHEPLVSETDFIAAQTITALARPADGATRTYRLVGVLRCALCDRRLISHRAYSRAWYRCRHGHTSTTPIPNRTRYLYLREDRLLHQITALLPDGPHIDSSVPTAIADYLRRHHLIAVCNATSVTVQPDTIAITR
jgi:DNA invertase Pin-like site-specific DNA recombinase